MIGERIKEMRELRGWTQDELAAKLGYKSRSSINKIELGIQDVPQKKIKEFARVLGCSTGFLLEDEPEELKAQSNLSRLNGLIRTVRVFDPISCGSGLMVDENAIGRLAVPVESVSKNTEYFSNQAEGDSMEPSIHNGDYVVFEETPVIESGQIGAFSLNGEYYCKRMKRLPDGAVWLFSDNTEYDPIPVRPDDNFRILGKYRMRLTRD